VDQLARRCRIPAFVKLARSIVKHKARILAAIEHNLSNGLIESTNTKIRLITRIAFGFKSPEALIALALLSLRPPQVVTSQLLRFMPRRVGRSVAGGRWA